MAHPISLSQGIVQSCALREDESEVGSISSGTHFGFYNVMESLRKLLVSSGSILGSTPNFKLNWLADWMIQNGNTIYEQLTSTC